MKRQRRRSPNWSIGLVICISIGSKGNWVKSCCKTSKLVGSSSIIMRRDSICPHACWVEASILLLFEELRLLDLQCIEAIANNSNHSVLSTIITVTSNFWLSPRHFLSSITHSIWCKYLTSKSFPSWKTHLTPLQPTTPSRNRRSSKRCN